MAAEKDEQEAILISGAASGLGAAFMLHYTSEYPQRSIIAIDCVPITLSESLRSHSQIQTFVVDVQDESSIVSLANSLKDVPISIIIHCAGVRGLVPAMVKSNPGDIDATETLEVMDKQTMQTTFDINCIGILLLVRALLPNLLRYSQNIEGSSNPMPPPRCVILGSRMGSVSANTAGGGYAYRASKAALNAVVKSLSIDVKEVAFAILHPGRVESKLVEWKEEGAISPEESVRDSVKIIDRLSLENTSAYVDRFGVAIEW